MPQTSEGDEVSDTERERRHFAIGSQKQNHHFGLDKSPEIIKSHSYSFWGVKAKHLSISSLQTVDVVYSKNDSSTYKRFKL